MEFVKKISLMQSLSQRIREEGKTISFVPTMGYLHQGHLSLIRQARKDGQVLIVSIFVNPTQFGAGEDYSRYPRDLERDKKLAEQEGVDILFVPSSKEMYPQGYHTFIEVEKLSAPLCGRSRPGHFRGVVTIVAKLFNIVSPHIAYFGQKDAQQALLIKRVVNDLNMDIEIKVLPIVREKDGLALSSRNEYLNPEERRAALVLYKSLQEAQRRLDSGERDSRKIIQRMEEIIKREKLARIDYVSIVDGETLEDRGRIGGKTLIALAVWIGKTRLIDNLLFEA
ncbi:pantoate--beta-alanine ligase [candidate division NPL-UPA2 bacterium]|nr:pantoate--beta-alanine ligase [candidate division NPL-UPA2 bacterium]